MFYVSGFDNNKRLWRVTDTSDGVEESYSFKDLKEFEVQGIKIHGMSKNCCHICTIVGDFIIVPSINDNSVEIYRLVDEVLTDKFCFNNVRNSRNNVWYCGSAGTKRVKDGICISCGVCVKYDIEFTGTFIIKINSHGKLIDRLDEVLFVCDNANEVHSWISCTGGDCPDFITSVKANKILKEKGMI